MLTTNTDHRPRGEYSLMLELAILRAQKAEQAWLDDDTCTKEHELKCQCPTALATLAADEAVDAARAALRASNEPREWQLTEKGYHYDAIAPNLNAALEIARHNVDPSSYDYEGTIWIDVRVRCEATDEEGSATVVCHQPEPDCADGHGHDWRAPLEIVGGIADNPGVWGHGGGVKIHEVCSHCGAHRHTDTWAQRPDTGEQGLTSVSYEDPTEESLAWVAEVSA